VRAEVADGRAAAAAPFERKHTWWPMAKRVITIAFVLVVLGLIADQARGIEWSKVLASIRAYPLRTLLIAGAITVLSHAVYSTYDLIGRKQTGHGLGSAKVVAVTFVSYAFNLNLGSIVGAFGMRYRLYSRMGLHTDVITQVLGLSLLTNWLGYMLLGGSVFLFRPLALPPDWKIGSEGLQWLGGAMLLFVVGYLTLCWRSTRREWTIRGTKVTLPSIRVALLQLGLSTLNWALMASIVYVLLQRHVDYASVLSVLLMAAVAGVATHVPAGLGVLEAVFVALLAHRMPQGDLIAGLLCYRAIYYLAPLCVAAIVFFAIDVRKPGSEAIAKTTTSKT
jgi:glycosyltransferase 2 family protein